MLNLYEADPGHIRQLKLALDKGRARLRSSNASASTSRPRSPSCVSSNPSSSRSCASKASVAKRLIASEE